MVYGTFFGGHPKPDDPHHQKNDKDRLGQADLTHLQLQRIRQTQQGQSNAFRYIVKPGDTLESIVASTHISLDHLISLNPYLVPTRSSRSSEAPPRQLYPGIALTMDKPGRILLPPTPALIDQGWGQMHLVTSQDSLVSIAAAYNTTPQAIRQANRRYFPSGEKGYLHPGQLLCIRQQNNVLEAQTGPLLSSSLPEPPPAQQYHVIDLSRGDSFDSICQQYQLNWTTFMKYNQHLFPTGSALQLVDGMKVVVYHPHHSCPDSNTATYRKNHNTHHHAHHRRIGEIQLTKAIHHVLEADTPESIAQEYHMSLDELREWNRAVFPKGYRGELCQGQKIVVKKRSPE